MTVAERFTRTLLGPTVRDVTVSVRRGDLVVSATLHPRAEVAHPVLAVLGSLGAEVVVEVAGDEATCVEIRGLPEALLAEAPTRRRTPGVVPVLEM